MHASTPITVSGNQTRRRIFDGSHESIILLIKDAQASLSGDLNLTSLYLTRALNILQEGETLPKTSFGCLANWQIKRVVDYIDAHLDAPIRTSRLAAVLSLSVSHFSHAFKNTFGMPPLAYLASRRIDSACQIMLTTDSSLTEIALSHGFCDQSHFSRTFRREIGMPPQTWRRLRRLELYEDQAVHPAWAKELAA
ncbi:AraC family transcriptional regulator [Pusillimonas sp. SM2304]|uniref:AraC family transcriptional regulator n=1 Tax=Pusillimonas sp. SM2304 TaxID=3073241 RepID=UPI0028770A0D|nr:AraC family transcriptional regulator [Pusillimonas sp. SM2304]MDS1139496.1 AraC family transcriptional regulator [Pusillimonas sp. SM2304]